jgi:hypothetical protein
MQQTINEILSHIGQCGGLLSDWYAGITDDPRVRLFTEHNVQERGDSWIYRDAGTANAARTIEQNLLDQGCDGGPGGGSNSSKYIYAYRKTGGTNENN